MCLSSPNFWVIPQNIPKNNKNKIKWAGVGRKINVEILDVFESPVVPLFYPEMKENTDLRKKIIYHLINLCKN